MVENRSANRRFNLRMYEKDMRLVDEWSERLSMTKTDFILAAIRHYAAFQKGNVKLPTAETSRLNQLIDVSQMQTQAILSLNQLIVQTFNQIHQLTLGTSPTHLTKDSDALLVDLPHRTSADHSLSETTTAIDRLKRIKLHTSQPIVSDQSYAPMQNVGEDH